MSDKNSTPRLKVRQTTIEALVWLAFATAAFVVTFDFAGPLPTFKLGAAFWPRMVIVGIFIVAGVLLVISLLRRGEDATSAIGERMTESLSESEALITPKTIAIFLLPLVYVYAIHKLGFLLVTPFFLIGFMRLLGIRKWRTLLGVSLGLYAAIVLIFVRVIFTPLPQGSGIFYTLNGHVIGLLQ